VVLFEFGDTCERGRKLALQAGDLVFKRQGRGLYHIVGEV
jgi:hypothetical protein